MLSSKYYIWNKNYQTYLSAEGYLSKKNISYMVAQYQLTEIRG